MCVYVSLSISFPFILPLFTHLSLFVLPAISLSSSQFSVSFNLLIYFSFFLFGFPIAFCRCVGLYHYFSFSTISYDSLVLLCHYFRLLMSFFCVFLSLCSLCRCVLCFQSYWPFFFSIFHYNVRAFVELLLFSLLQSFIALLQNYFHFISFSLRYSQVFEIFFVLFGNFSDFFLLLLHWRHFVLLSMYLCITIIPFSSFSLSFFPYTFSLSKNFSKKYTCFFLFLFYHSFHLSCTFLYSLSSPLSYHSYGRFLLFCIFSLPLSRSLSHNPSIIFSFPPFLILVFLTFLYFSSLLLYLVQFCSISLILHIRDYFCSTFSLDPYAETLYSIFLVWKAFSLYILFSLLSSIFFSIPFFDPLHLPQLSPLISCNGFQL